MKDETYQKFVDKKIKKHVEKLRTRVIFDKFGNTPKKAVKEAFLASEEYKRLCEEKFNKDVTYSLYTQGRIYDIPSWHDEYLREVATIEAAQLYDDALENCELEKVADQYIEKLRSILPVETIKEIEEYYKDGDVYVNVTIEEYSPYAQRVWANNELELLGSDNFESLKEDISSNTYLDTIFGCDDDLPIDDIVEFWINNRLGEFIDILLERIKESFPDRYEKCDKSKLASNLQDGFYDNLFEGICDIEKDIDTAVEKKITYIYVLELLCENPQYKDIAAQYLGNERNRERFEKEAVQLITEHMPDKYADFYPLARKISRKFVLHIGPTNSGKTYSAVKALEEASSGIYLGPLRLLAYEEYEKLTDDGNSCSLITGEEKKIVSGSSFVASTIEMADISKYYVSAVVDEGQLVSDPQKGGAYTRVILGLCADTIHICTAPEAEKLLIRLINECGDSVEVVRYERFTPLEMKGKPVCFPDDIEPGDACVVFSRKDIYAAAAELQAKNIKCSLIYGALPYDVKHKQAELFEKGVNQVLVATDAIGMGMNLPIKRVVFLQSEKFDGSSVRTLNISEIKQIAGRAGRFGLYDTGYVAACESITMFKKALKKDIEDCEFARVRFPDIFAQSDKPLSILIEKWRDFPDKEGYLKDDTSDMIKLCKLIEDKSPNNSTTYKLITMPFDIENEELLDIWKGMFVAEISEEKYDITFKLNQCKKLFTSSDIEALEKAYKVCDLLHTYIDRFAFDMTELDKIDSVKSELSNAINKLLAKTKYKRKTCKYCGAALPWGYRYGMCEECHEERYPSHYNYDDDNEFYDEDNDDDDDFDWR